MGLMATELAQHLNLTKGRISQLVADGRLAGCYSGEGRHRRFDLAACAEALSRKLDAGQMLGNGSGTKKRLKDVIKADPTPDLRRSDLIAATDPDRYELARSAKAEEELRAMKLRNGREEGLYVLASEVEVNVSRLLAQNLAEIEVFLRDAARLVADKMGIDARETRQLMIGAWREMRMKQSDRLSEAAAESDLSATEQDAQI